MSIHQGTAAFTKHRQFTANADDFGFGEKGFNARALRQQAGFGNVNGSIGDILHDQEEKEEEKKRKLNEAVYRASASTAIITTAMGDAINSWIDDTRKQLSDELAERQRELAEARGEVEIGDRELQTACDQERVTGMRAVRSADELSMLRLDEYQKRQLLDQQREELRAARISGDTERTEKAREAFRGTWQDIKDIEQRIISGMSESDRHAEEHRRAQERRSGIEARRADLRANVDRLEKDVANIKGRLSDMDKFSEYYRSADTQAKLAKGELTIEQMRKDGVPESILEKLEGEVLTQENLRKFSKDEHIGLSRDTAEALRSEGKDYLTTNYDAFAETINETYKTISDGVSYVANGVSSAVSGIYGYITGDSPTGDRTGTTAARTDGQGISAVPRTTQVAWNAAVQPREAAPTQTFAPRPEVAMTLAR